MSDTCGQSFFDWFEPAGPRSSSESKSHPQKLSVLSLRLISLSRFKQASSPEQTNSQSASLQSRISPTVPAGSMEYALTWKRHITPSGRLIFRLRALRHRTPDSGYSGWPTPEASMVSNCLDVQFSGDGRQTPNKLGWAAALSGWPTPRAEDSESPGAHRGNPDTLPSATKLSGWATPTASETVRSEAFQAGRELNAMEALAGWATPVAQDCEAVGGPKQRSLWNQTTGRYSESSTAGTEKSDESALNPAMSRWLLGYPSSWDRASPGFEAWQKMQDAIASADSGATEMPSCQPSPQSS